MRKKKKHEVGRKEGIFKRFMEIFKKSSENEKRKKEMRLREKRSKPKGYKAKRFGAFTFWVLFLFMLLIVVVNVFSTDGVSNATNASDVSINRSTTPEGIEFAKSFVTTYFNWDAINEKRGERIGRLGIYLPENLSEKAMSSDKKWSSMTTRENVVLLKVDDLGDSKAHITFKVRVVFENTVPDKKQEGENSEPKPTKMKATKYITVPVFHDIEQDCFIVYELPSFSYVDELSAGKGIEPETDGLKPVRSGTQNINVFLETFFEAYANDPKDKLTYIVADPNHQHGLSQTMDFIRLKNTEIFEGKNSQEKVVQTEVVLADPETRIEFASNYILVLQEKDMRYTVQYINNKRYIDELKNKQFKEAVEATESTELESLTEENLNESNE